MLDREFKLYFLHVPKTAFTSLRYWLWDAFASEDFLECHRVVEPGRGGFLSNRKGSLLFGPFWTSAVGAPGTPSSHSNHVA